MNQYVCRFCRQPSDPNSPTCPLCGAPVDIRDVVSDSGWIEQPPIRDMARIQFGQSHCQIEGTTVPVADFTLAQQDMIYFSHHALLWTDPTTRLTNMSMRGGWKRMKAGMPLIMMRAQGPGHIAFSADHPGETLALPLHQALQPRHEAIGVQRLVGLDRDRLHVLVVIVLQAVVMVVIVAMIVMMIMIVVLIVSLQKLGLDLQDTV